MSRILWTLCGYTLFVVAAFVAITTWLDRQQDRASWSARESLLQDSLAKTVLSVRRDSVTVTKWVTKTEIEADTLYWYLTDTLRVKEYIRSTDTLRQHCLACVNSAARLHVWSDSSIQFWKGRFEAVRPTWRDRVGVTVGYGITKDGTDVKIGPQVGVSIRVFP